MIGVYLIADILLGDSLASILVLIESRLLKIESFSFYNN